MAADTANEGPPLSELESLQLKANQTTDDSLESTRRMIQLCEDSQAAGTKTLDMLDNQGEQLDRIESGMDNMNADMKEAEKHITGMEKWCGLFVCPWKRAPKIRDSDATWKKPSGKPAPAKPSQPGQNGGSQPGQNGQYVKRINNDAREDEMEENLQAVGSILGNLKAMAIDMEGEIGNQNQQLDRLNAKAAHGNVKISAANKRTEKLLNK